MAGAMRNLIPSSFDTTLILRIWAWLFAFSGFIVYFFHGISFYLFLAALGSLLAAAVMLAVIHLFSEGMDMLFTGRNGSLPIDQELQPEFDKIRYHFSNGSYKKARRVAREILVKYPDHGETLIWKAKLTLAEDNDIHEATSVLKKVVRDRSNRKEIRSWAKTLLEELRLGEKGRK
jgi:hypothetical protein